MTRRRRNPPDLRWAVASLPVALCPAAQAQFRDFLRLPSSHISASTSGHSDGADLPATQSPIDLGFAAEDVPSCTPPIRGQASAHASITEQWSQTAITWNFAGDGHVSVAMPPPCRATETASAIVSDTVAFSLDSPAILRVDGLMHLYAGEGGSDGVIEVSGPGGVLFHYVADSTLGSVRHLVWYLIAPAGRISVMRQSYCTAGNTPTGSGDSASADFSGTLEPLDQPVVTPASVTLSGLASAQFSLLPAELPAPGRGLSYQWQVRQGAGNWVDLPANFNRVYFPSGGWAMADTPNNPSARITIVPAPGVTACQVACNIRDDHSTFSIGPADYTICYANCDASTTAPILSVNDFLCYMSRFAAGDTLANCDGNSLPPYLDVNDFICFQSHFAAGCP